MDNRLNTPRGILRFPSLVIDSSVSRGSVLAMSIPPPDSINVSAAAAPASEAAACLTATPVPAAAAAPAVTPHNALRTGVGFSILSERNEVMKGVRNTLKVLCQIKPPKKEARQRPPFHIAVVLDKSGSMQTENRLRNSKRVMNINLCMCKLNHVPIRPFSRAPL